MAFALQCRPSRGLRPGSVRVLVAAAEEQLGATETAGGDDHSCRDFLAADQLTAFDPIEDDSILSVGWFDVSNDVQWTHLGAVLLGSRNVIEVERVLGAHIAADVAVAEMDAGALLLAVGVDERLRMLRIERVVELVVPILGKADRQGGFRESIVVAEIVSRVARDFEAACQLSVRHHREVHFFRNRVVIRLQFRVGDLGRPSASEDVRVGLERHAAVGQRTAADSGGLRDRHVLEEAHVEPAVVTLRFAVVVDPRIARLAWELLDFPAAAALEHQHAHPFFGKATRGDRAAEAAADDDDVERRAHG